MKASFLHIKQGQKIPLQYLYVIQVLKKHKQQLEQKPLKKVLKTYKEKLLTACVTIFATSSAIAKNPEPFVAGEYVAIHSAVATASACLRLKELSKIVLLKNK